MGCHLFSLTVRAGTILLLESHPHAPPSAIPIRHPPIEAGVRVLLRKFFKSALPWVLAHFRSKTNGFWFIGFVMRNIWIFMWLILIYLTHTILCSHSIHTQYNVYTNQIALTIVTRTHFSMTFSCFVGWHNINSQNHYYTAAVYYCYSSTAIVNVGANFKIQARRVFDRHICIFTRLQFKFKL
jgi:hypothetical protein